MGARLAQAGCSTIYITSRTLEACNEAIEFLRSLPNLNKEVKFHSIAADVSKVDQIEELVLEVSKTTSHLDILVANAGVTWRDPFDTYSEVGFATVMDLNVKGVFYTIQKLTPLLVGRASSQDPSRVIITASIAGLRIGTFGPRGTYAYSISKAAAIHLAKNLAVDLGPRGIMTNAIAPGYFATSMTSSTLAIPGFADRLNAGSPNGRIGRPDDIAGLVVFLSSRASSHINGAVIPVDGGSLLMSTV